jgi:hypothetical protein
MSQDELLQLLHRAARMELDEILASVLLVRLPDGTEKSAIELSEEEFDSLQPSMKPSTAFWILRHHMAERNYIHGGGGEFKRIDHLTLEDAPRLRAESEERASQEEAALRVVDFIAEGLQGLESMGVEVDWEDDETLGDWLRKDRD